MSVDFEVVASALQRAEAVKFGNFKLKDGSDSPIYIDLRVLRSHPLEKFIVVSAYQQLIEGLKFSCIADIPTGATPLVSSLCDRLQIPQITPRMDLKDHGSGAKIDGSYKKGDRVLLIDDLITKATSKFEAIQILEAEDLVVEDVAVLIDRQQGGFQELKKQNYSLTAYMLMSELAVNYKLRGWATQEQFEKTLALTQNVKAT